MILSASQLFFLVEGKSNKEISVILNLGIYTIESYRKTLIHKTDAPNTADLVRFAFKTGLAF